MRKGYISKFEAKFFKEAKFWVRPNFEARPNLVSDIAKPGFGVCPDWADLIGLTAIFRRLLDSQSIILVD